MPILSCSHDAYALFSEEFNGKKKEFKKPKNSFGTIPLFMRHMTSKISDKM
jgi:hypothetical protein